MTKRIFIIDHGGNQGTVRAVDTVLREAGFRTFSFRTDQAQERVAENAPTLNPDLIVVCYGEEEQASNAAVAAEKVEQMTGVPCFTILVAESHQEADALKERLLEKVKEKLA